MFSWLKINSLKENAQKFTSQGKFQDAIQAYNEILSLAKGKNAIEYLNTLLSLGEIKCLSKDFAIAGYYFEQAVFFIKNNPMESSITTEVYIKSADCFYERQKIQESLTLYLSAIQVMETQKISLDFKLKKHPLKQVSKIYKEQGNIQTSIVYLEKLVVLFQQESDSDKVELLHLYEELGICYAELRQWKLAASREEQAYSLSKSVNTALNLQPSILYRMAVYHYRSGQTEHALKDIHIFFHSHILEVAGINLLLETHILAGDIMSANASIQEWIILKVGNQENPMKNPNFWGNAMKHYKAALQLTDKFPDIDLDKVKSIVEKKISLLQSVIAKTWLSKSCGKSSFQDGLTDELRNIEGEKQVKIEDNLSSYSVSFFRNLFLLYIQLAQHYDDFLFERKDFLDYENQNVQNKIKALDAAVKMWTFISRLEAPKFIKRYGERQNQASIFSNKKEWLSALVGKEVFGNLFTPKSLQFILQANPDRNRINTSLEKRLLHLEVTSLLYGEKNEETLDTHHGLGWDYFLAGQYSKAHQHFEFALRGWLEKGELFTEDLEILVNHRVFTLKGLVQCCIKLGKLDKAKACCLVAINLLEKGKLTEYGAYYEELLNLITINLEKGNTDESCRLLNSIQPIPDIATHVVGRNYLLGELALYYLAVHQYEDALTATYRLKNAKYFAKMKLQPAVALEIEGRILLAQGRYSESLKKLEASLALFRDNDNPELDSEISLLHILVALIRGEKQIENVIFLANKYIYSAAKYVQDRCRLSLDIIDDEARYYFLKPARHMISLCHSLIVLYPTLSNRDILTLTLLMKNACAEASYIQHAKLFSRPEYIEYYQNWRRLKQEERKLYPEWKAELLNNNLGKQIFEAENILLRKMCASEDENQLKRLDLNNIATSLKEGDVVLEYGSFYFTDGLDENTHETRSTLGLEQHSNFPKGRHYYASLLSKDEVKTVYLHECQIIDAIILQLNREISGSGFGCNPLLKPLYYLLIKPFLSELAGIKHLYIAPDQELCKLPFELLLDENLIPLYEKIPCITYLSTARSLLNSESTQKQFDSISIFANPAFQISSQNHDETQLEQNNISRDIGNLITIDQISNLPFSAVESKEIQYIVKRSKSAMNCKVFEAEQANTDNFLHNTSSIMHIASHGFAFGFTEPKRDGSTSGATRRSIPFQSAEDPMKRSGILLSGIINALKGENIAEKYGDGMITASDILSLNLQNVSLMVLSSCKGALGTIQTGEGIQGLRRALEIAGVKTLICTLWDIDDMAGALFMKKFYEELFWNYRSDLISALSNAKAFVRDISLLQLIEMGFSDSLFQRQECIDMLQNIQDIAKGNEELAKRLMMDRKPFSKPKYWAGYIIIGQV